MSSRVQSNLADGHHDPIHPNGSILTVPRLRRPYRWLLAYLTLIVIALVFTYVVVSASWQAMHDRWSSPAEYMQPRMMDVVIATFFFVTGASVGSFLNVVVWRLPRGRGVNGQSECPRCKNLLRAQDNVPIIGWLMLGGRCRDCRLPISSRYPLVELAVATCFALVGTACVYRLNLPSATESGYLIWVAAPRVDATLLCILLIHLTALAGLWAMALIRFDQLPIPRSLVLFVGGVLVVGFFAVPPAMVVPWQMMDAAEPRMPLGWPPQTWWQSNRDFAGSVSVAVSSVVVQTAVRIITALVAAGFVARVLAKSLCPTADLKLDPLGKQTVALLDVTALLAVPAVVVGWQSLSGVVVVAALMAWAMSWGVFGQHLRSIADPLRRFALALPIALTLQLVFWRALIDTGTWPSPQASRGVLLLFGGLVLVSPFWLRFSGDDRESIAADSAKSRDDARQAVPLEDD